jgi:hypothetical protein
MSTSSHGSLKQIRAFEGSGECRRARSKTPLRFATGAIVFVCRNRDTLKWVLEQTPCPPVGFVDSLGIGVEEVGELIADVSGTETSRP